MTKRILAFMLFVTVVVSASLFSVSSYAEDIAEHNEYASERELLEAV